MRDAACASRRLLRFNDSETRLKRAMDIYCRFFAKGEGQGCDPRATVIFCTSCTHCLGITYSEMRRDVEAEKALRDAIDGLHKVRRIYLPSEQPLGYWRSVEARLMEAHDSLAIVLGAQGKHAAKRRLLEETVRPLWARALLGPVTADAEARAFGFEDVLVVDLPDANAMECLLKWNGCHAGANEVGASAGSRSMQVKVKLRVLQRFQELLGPVHPKTVAVARSLLWDHNTELLLEEMEALYRFQKAAPINQGETQAGADPGGLAGSLGARLMDEATLRGGIKPWSNAGWRC